MSRFAFVMFLTFVRAPLEPAVLALEAFLIALVVLSGIDYTRRYLPYLRQAAARRS